MLEKLSFPFCLSFHLKLSLGVQFHLKVSKECFQKEQDRLYGKSSSDAQAVAIVHFLWLPVHGVVAL